MVIRLQLPLATAHCCVKFQSVLPYFWQRQRQFGDHKEFGPIGQQPQNPLLLLEQYSDEESEGGSTEGHDHTVSEDASENIDKEAAIVTGADTNANENNDGKEHDVQKVGQLPVTNGSASQKPDDVTISETSDDLQRHTNKLEEATYAAASDGGFIGDVGSGWKMVLHEESNQYYYWNIVTGETSWDVPGAVMSVEETDDNTKGKIDAVVEMDKTDTLQDIEDNYIFTRKVGESKNICQNCDASVAGTNVDGFHEVFKGDHIDGKEGSKDGNHSDVSCLLGKHFVENETGAELPSRLIKQYEGLLDRLISVKGLNCSAEDKDLKLKCSMEIEMRLADIKALASHGSSLLMFWLYSEGQLKRLEVVVDDAIKRHYSASPSGFDAGVDSSSKRVFTPAESHMEHITESSNFEALNDVGGKIEITVAEKETMVNPGPAPHPGEDVDMDVDMEVEDAPSLQSPHRVASGAHDHVSSELSSLQNKQAEPESMVPGQVLNSPLEEWIPPPPPDGEPFPPPPPDDEPFPPPPPDEPPETSYPSSSHLGSVQHFPYSEQYALPYAGPTHEYYGQPNLDASASTLYTHPEAGQVTVAHVPHYYESVPNLYGVSPLVVNPVDPTAYYGPQNVSLNHIPLISGSEASINQSGPVPENLDSANQDSLVNGEPKLLAKSTINAVESGHGNAMVPAEVHDAQPAVGATETSSVVNGVSVSSTSENTSVPAVAAAAAAAASKAQTKVSRKKKRTVAVVSSLRSNKKVSSLVDKWKAAKEELQEEEEEPLDAYEVLERKRRREIEEWRAQQIGSGEAKDNANFQPLGGDWRERVKRKRAERMKEKEQSPSDVAPDRHQQQIDIVELSKGLPSGWQAYWDDSSKQVYYGNTLTSETTWTRPAD